MTVTAQESAVTTIMKARELLDKDGWTQGREKDHQGRRCLIRALRDADGPGEKEAVRIISALIGRTTIPGWNDTSGRKYEEIKTLLDAAKHIAQELAE